MKAFLACVAFILGTLATKTWAFSLPKWRTSDRLVSSDNCQVIGTANHDTRLWHDDVLGDLIIDDSWYGHNRPQNYCPLTRSKIGTQFILHTREDPGENTDTYLYAEDGFVETTTFDPSRPTKFVTHGFIDTGRTAWVMVLVRALLAHGDYNVIRVNWGGGSLPLYAQAVANTRVVGLEVSYLVNFLVENHGVDPADVHLMGHSLGGHAMGYAGEKITGLGRITGFDPAGPYFTETPDFIRIDPTDAVFVACIHTDADTIFMLGYGTEQPMCNLDFFPNSGHDQPGCDPVTISIDLIIDLPEGGRELVACSHQRSVYLFIDSLEESCPFVAHECFDYETFDTGRCSTCDEDDSKCAKMGINAIDYPFKDRANTTMYFDTDKTAPFCYYHYQMILDLAHPKHASDDIKGHLDVWMYGEKGEIVEKLRITDRVEHFQHGQVKYLLAKTHQDLSRVVKMDVKWTHVTLMTEEEEEEEEEEEKGRGNFDDDDNDSSNDLLNHKLYIRNIQVGPMEHIHETSRLDHATTLCLVGHDYAEISSGGKKTLTNDASCVVG